MMWGGGGWPGAWLAPVLGVSAVLFWVLVVAIVLAVARGLGVLSGGEGAERDEAGRDARRVLDLRYARGEIDAEEYAERRRVLSG